MLFRCHFFIPQKLRISNGDVFVRAKHVPTIPLVNSIPMGTYLYQPNQKRTPTLSPLSLTHRKYAAAAWCMGPRVVSRCITTANWDDILGLLSLLVGCRLLSFSIFLSFGCGSIVVDGGGVDGGGVLVVVS
jgi:hypothetical protein